jgi:hypothetical protein
VTRLQEANGGARRGVVVTPPASAPNAWVPEGPRAYSAGTSLALYALANGNCYFPDCSARVVVFVEGHPVNNAQIAHVYGANPGSARYDPAMTDGERRSFANLILLCKSHHTLVDTVVPDQYDAATLLQWKAIREAACGP